MGPGITIDLTELERWPPRRSGRETSGRDMKKRSEKQQDLDKLKPSLPRFRPLFFNVSGITVEDAPSSGEPYSRGGKYKVVKNTLAERAGAGTPDREPAQELERHEFHVSMADPVALAKASRKLPRSSGISVRSGVVEGRVISIKEIQQLASLPSKDELIRKIMFLLNAPQQRIAMALNAFRAIWR